MANGNELPPPAAAAADEFLIWRVFDVPRSVLFAMWTNPGHLARWWGPRDFTNPVCEVDARPGGRYRIVMRSPEGADLPLKGEFLEVEAPRRLVMTIDCSEHPVEWHDLINPGRDRSVPPALVMMQTVTFEEEAGRTRMTIRTRFDSAAIRDAAVRVGMNEGWSQSLDRLEARIAEEVSATAGRELVFSRVFSARREVVFRAWTEPDQVVRWWGPRGFTTTTEVMEVRPGGVWKHTMHGPDGADYPNTMRYIEVARPERLVYTNSGQKVGGTGVTFQSTVLFEEQADGRTKVTLRMVFPSRAARDIVIREYGAEEGAFQMMDRLAAHLGGVR